MYSRTGSSQSHCSHETLMQSALTFEMAPTKATVAAERKRGSASASVSKDFAMIAKTHRGKTR